MFYIIFVGRECLQYFNKQRTYSMPQVLQVPIHLLFLIHHKRSSMRIQCSSFDCSDPPGDPYSDGGMSEFR